MAPGPHPRNSGGQRDRTTESTRCPHAPRPSECAALVLTGGSVATHEPRARSRRRPLAPECRIHRRRDLRAEVVIGPPGTIRQPLAALRLRDPVRQVRAGGGEDALVFFLRHLGPPDRLV